MNHVLSLTGSMVEHLSMLKDDDILGRALVKVFRHKVMGEDFTCSPDEYRTLGFIVDILREDMEKASRNCTRSRTSRERFSNGNITVSERLANGNITVMSSPFPSPKEKEISPHTPLKGKEITPTHTPRARASEAIGRDIDANFERFWVAYPRKVAKQDAYKAFVSVMAKVKDITSHNDMMIYAVLEQSKTDDWRKESGKYIPYPATWLRAGRWDDVLDVNQSTNAESTADCLAKEMIGKLLHV